MSFLFHFNESKFRELPESVFKEAEMIANLYLNSDKKKRKKLTPRWKKYFKSINEPLVKAIQKIGHAEFEDLKTGEEKKYRVVVAYAKENPSLAAIDDNEKLIILYDSNFRELSKTKIISTIYHEIVHGMQQHKEYSKKYKKLFKDDYDEDNEDLKEIRRTAYYIEPVEFDAFMTELSLTINKEFVKLKNDIANSKFPQTKQVMERRLEKFLKELKVFIDAPLNTYFVYNELPLPYTFEEFDEMLENINKSPKHWQTFKKKLNNLYQELEKIQN